jgi:hypothetical protein
MRLLFSTGWLRRKIASDPDGEPTAGDHDMGERYIVTFYDENANVRRLYGRTNDLEMALLWTNKLDRPSVFPQLTDRSREPGVREKVIRALWEKQFEGSPWQSKFHLILPDSLEADYGTLADKIIATVRADIESCFTLTDRRQDGG